MHARPWVDEPDPPPPPAALDSVLGAREPPRPPARVAPSPVVRSWSNDPDALPTQQTSFTSFAAGQLAQRIVAVPSVACMERESRAHHQNTATGAVMVPLAVVPNTALALDMYASAHRLTTLENPSHLERLQRAEEAELKAAALGFIPPAGTLAARPLAITILVNPTTTPNAAKLLDAVAHLARAPNRADPPECAAQTIRLALLAGQSARAYALAHAAAAQSTRSKSASNETELCVSWCEPVDGGEWVMRSEFASIAYCVDESAYAAEVVRAVTTLCAKVGLAPPSSRLFASYEHSGSMQGAYVQSVRECALDFWKRLRVTSPARLSEQASADENLRLQFSELFVRVSPKALGSKLDDASTFPGLLVHAEGWKSEANDFCGRVKNEEYGRAHAENRKIAAFALRPPATLAEESVCLHLLLLHADWVDLGAAFSLYGVENVPGMPLSKKNGNVLPRIFRRLVPLDDEILNEFFVLPCDQNKAGPVHPQHWQWLWDTFKESVTNFAPYFRHHDPSGNPISPRLCAVNATAPAPVERAPTQLEASVNVLLGVPLSSPALRLGEVYNVVRDECGAESPVANLLMAVGAQVGLEASVCAGLEHATAIVAAHEDRERKHEV